MWRSDSIIRLRLYLYADFTPKYPQSQFIFRILSLFFRKGCRSSAFKLNITLQKTKKLQNNTTKYCIITVLCYYATKCCLYHCNITIIWVVYTNYCLLLPTESAITVVVVVHLDSLLRFNGNSEESTS